MHLFANMSLKVYKAVLLADFSGIMLMFIASGYAYMSYKYSCGPFKKWVYIFMALYLLCTIAFVYVFISEKLTTIPRRLSFFVIFGITCYMPVYLIKVWHDPKYMMDPTEGNCFYSILTYLVGGVFYGTRFPECCSRTGKFDILGASHQIFHVFVFLAIYYSIYSLNELYLQRLEFVCPSQ